MTQAQSAQLNTILIGGGLAAAAAFMWSRRAALFPGLAPAATPALDPYGYPIAPTPAAPMVPLISAPVPLPQAYPIAPVVGSASPNTIVVNTPNGPAVVSTFDQRLQGCRVGPSGGIECPDNRGGAVPVSDAQRDPCRAPTDQEISAAQTTKPLWSRDYAATRLTQLRQAVCALKLAPFSAATESALTGHRIDYSNLTGVQLL